MRALLLLLLLALNVHDASAQSAVLSPELSQMLARPSSSGPDPAGQGLTALEGAEERFNVIVYTSNPMVVETVGARVESRFPLFVTARLTLEQIAALAQTPGINGIEYSFSAPHNDGAAALVGARSLNQGLLRGSAYTGAGVLACVIDSGIDPFHRDFRFGADTLSSRIFRIWDQLLGNGGSDPLRDGEARPAGFSYGVEFTREHIEAQLRGETAGFVRTMDINGHGTHVAGTMAATGFALQGRHRGMAPEADLVIIRAGNASFSNAGVIDGISYCHQVATAAGRPAVLNMSLGSDFGPHDGSDARNVASSVFGSTPGRIVVKSAGNSGARNIHKQTDALPQDSGFFELNVPVYTPTAGLDNDGVSLDTWLNSNLPVRVEVTTPNGITVAQNPQGQSDHATTDGFVYLYNFIAPGSDSQSGHRRIYMDVYDDVLSDTTRNPAVGLWRVTLINQDETRSFEAHTWMVRRGGLANTVLVGGDAEYTVSNAAQDAIIAGSYRHRPRWMSESGSSWSSSSTQFEISSFSSRGPSRDGRTMPHVAAPGEYMISAKPSVVGVSVSQLAPGGVHYLSQGTSMSAPVIAGSAALLLQHDPTLTTPQARTLLQETAYGDALTAALPNNRFGAGRLDVYSAMARLVDAPRSLTMERVYYTTSLPTTTGAFATSVAVGMRATHPFVGPGFLRGMALPLWGNGPAAGTPIVFRAYTSNAGAPGALVGAVSVPMPAQSGGTLTYFDFGSQPIALQGGHDYILTAHSTNGTLTLIHDNTSGNTRFGSWNTTTQAWTPTGTRYPMIALFAEDVSAALQPVAYTQNFQTLNSSTLPDGWMASAGSGAQTYGGTWGTGASSGLRGEGNVLGFQHTTETDVFRTTLTLQNATGQTVEALKIRFLGRTSRTDAPHTPSWTVTVNGTPVTALTYETALGFDVPITAIATGLSIPPDAHVAIEWASSRDANVAVESRQIGIGEVSVEWVYAVPLQQAERFALLASPVQTTYASLLSTTWTQGAANANTPLGGANVWRWNATSQAWASVDSLSRSITAGAGFLTYVFPRARFEVPNSTHFPRAIGAYGAGHALPLTLEATTVANGYLLYGNPSRSTLSWNALGRTNVSEVVSVLDAQTGQYHTFNGATGELEGGLIAPFQGFFVTAVDAGATTLNITEDALTSGGVFRGKTERDVFEARIAVSGEALRAATWLSFLEEGAVSADPFDAPFLQPLAPHYLRWASVRGDGAMLSIQSLPQHLAEPVEIPLHLESTRDGTYALEATRVRLPHGMQGTLHDRLSGTSMPFEEGLRHTVTLSARATGKTEPGEALQVSAESLAADALPRFVLRLSGGMATAAEPTPESLTFNLEAIFPNPVQSSGTLRFTLPEARSARVTVYDLLGRHIATLTDAPHPAGTHTLTLNTATWPTGVYIVRLEAGDRTQTKRFSVVR